KQVQSTADTFDAYVDRVAVLPRAISARKEATGGEVASGIIGYLQRLLESLPPEEAFGVYLAMDNKQPPNPDAMPWVDRNSAPNALRPAGGPRDRSMEWYAGAKRTGKLYLS